MAIIDYLWPVLSKFAKKYFFNSTLGVFREALMADSFSAGAELVLAEAANRSEEFWLDVLLLSVALLLVVLVANFVVRMFCWYVVSVPLGVRELKKMEKGELQYQKDAKAAREARAQRIRDGLEEPPRTAMEDLKEISAKIAQMRGELEERGVKLSDQPLIPEASVPSRRNPPSPLPSSVIGGFPEVNLLLPSPSQRFLLVGCRSKRKTCLYVQGNDPSFVTKGKLLQEATTHTSVEVAVRAALQLGEDGKVEIYSASFSETDEFLCVAERNSDNMVCFAVGQSGSLTPRWSSKLPDKRLVSGLPEWHLVDENTLVCRIDATCDVEALMYSGGTLTSVHERLKVGKAVSWAVGGNLLGVGGSFMREPRVFTVEARPGRKTVLTPVMSLFGKNRVLAMTFVRKGAPKINTRNYYVTFDESGMGFVYDLDSLQQSNLCEVVARFEDTDFAGYDETRPLRIITAVRGKSHYERILIGLVQGNNVAIYTLEFSQEREATVTHLVDFYGIQECGVVGSAAFVQNGLGLATCGDRRDRNVKLFPVPEKQVKPKS